MFADKDPKEDLLKKAFDPAEFRKHGHWLVDRLADHLETSLDGKGPVVSYQAPEKEFQAWSRPPDSFAPLVDHFLAQSMRLQHPRYMGHQTGVASPLSALAELASALLNNSGAVFEMGPGSGMIEKHTLNWMIAKLGFGSRAEGIFTSGGTLGNLTALLAARRHILGEKSWHEGMNSHPLPCFLASNQIH
jgi:L-2,4-diaminobutyrate decarboxylase